jgi:hypothetical protein
LLRILAGRHLTHSKVRVLGLDAYHDTRLNFYRAYLDCDWGMKTVAFVGTSPLTADIAVADMMVKLQESHPERREELLTMLGIDLRWRMHQLSDGQRRRVQIFLGLLRPFEVLMLDEVTTSLDVCVRQDLLRWLVRATWLCTTSSRKRITRVRCYALPNIGCAKNWSRSAASGSTNEPLVLAPTRLTRPIAVKEDTLVDGWKRTKNAATA